MHGSKPETGTFRMLLNHSAFPVVVLILLTQGAEGGSTVHVACASSGPECGTALQQAIDAVPAGTTITLDAGKIYERALVIRPKDGAGPDARLTITTRGWTSKGEGWDGIVTPDDRASMAAIRATHGENAAIRIENGPASGYVTLMGLAFEATPPGGQGDLIRIGTGDAATVDELARHVVIRQVLLQGDPTFGQKRGIAANGQDIDIEQIWCAEIFVPSQDSQCVAAWSGGHRVRVRYAYLAAGSENLLLGGAPVASPSMQPSDWLIEDVILHKPRRWQQDGRNRQVKNLLEFKHGRNITARRVLGVNNWRAAQDGRSVLIHYTTNGPCPACGNLENVLVEDLVLLNVTQGLSFQGYSWQPDSRSDGRLVHVTVRNAYVQLSGGGRLIQITNVGGRHDIRIERSTFLNHGTGWLVGSFGYAWLDDDTRVKGGPMQGLWLLDNVIANNGEYGITAPDGHHFGRGIGTFVEEDLQIAGNVIGNAPRPQLANYNAHTAGGDENVRAPRDELLSALPTTACGEWAPSKGAECDRLRPVFERLTMLPEP